MVALRYLVIYKLVRLDGNGQIQGMFAIVTIHEVFQLMGYYIVNL